MRTCEFIVATVVGIACVASASHRGAAAEVPPNILVILADDLGIECVGAYGGRSHATPNIDALAAQGMRFTHCFSNPLCSPSRAALLTGRYPFMNGMTEVLWNWKRHGDTFLSPDQPSFARQLKKAGYTTAIAGKWQLSFLTRHDTVRDFGFDQYQCWQIFHADGQKTTRFRRPTFRQNGETVADAIQDRYGPDVNADFLIDFIKASARDKRPFLAYCTCLLPHFPWEPTPDSADQDYALPSPESKGDPKYFPDDVAYLDKIVGRLVQSLDDAGVAENTVVIFLADNGTDRDVTNVLENGKAIPGGKGTMTDRGTRVPLIVRWPGRIAAGSVCGDLVDFSDLLPTFCDLAGADLPAEPIHGRSFLPQLEGEKGSPREWVHMQNKADRMVRDRQFMLSNRGELRRVGELWETPPVLDSSRLTAEEQAARSRLQEVFDELEK